MSDRSGQPVIELEDVHVVLGSNLALDIEALEICAGERVFVLGHSGSGKTTLSRLIKGRTRPSTGRVTVLGHDPAAPESRRRHRRRVAMIDQEYHLVPRLSVAENVLHGCLGRVSPWTSLLGWYPAAEHAKAGAILEEVELAGMENRRVETLSGGQRQRTAIARALMQDADVILADEPVSALDPELAEDALELMVECVARRNVTLLVNLHQPDLAARFASRFIGLANGKLVYDGPPSGFTERDAELVYRGKPSEKPTGDSRQDDRLAQDLEAADRRPGLHLVGD
ncbi:MAG: ATP-binding cassette domain-containing protein [Acidobacteria bacterium]|nr:ATP-binding cassette domain-containing protein [Acidobacteriota bacterium]